MIPFDEAIARLVAVARPLGAERVPLDRAHGRVLAAPVHAQWSAPATDVSTMDGYAVRDADLGALPARLTVTGESFPGRGIDGAVPPDAAVRIFTGAPVPMGADRIVIQENVRREGDVALIERFGPERWIRAAGSDFQVGDELVAAGTWLAPSALVAAAAADLSEVEVWRRPRLRLISTGDELAEPGQARPGRIPDSIGIAVAALARDWGGEPVERLRLGDDLAALTEAAGRAVDGADLVVVTGGASVGARDFGKAMFGEGLELLFSKVSIKPGKPVWLGRAGGALVLGLPGNPTSALVTAQLFLAPLLAGLSGRDPHVALRWRRAALAEAVGQTGDRETFSRAVREGARARLLPNQDSGAQRTLAAAELLVRRPPGERGYAAGDELDVLEL